MQYLDVYAGLPPYCCRLWHEPYPRISDCKHSALRGSRHAQNTETADEFLNGITELMQELVARYQGISEEKKNQFQGKAKGEVIGKCPRCGADVQEGKVNFYCSDRNCTFTLWKNDKFLASQGKKMDKTAAKKFLSKGKIHYKDLVSRKTGRQYDCISAG